MKRSDNTKRLIRVFIASPRGLEEARHGFKETIDKLNKGFGDELGVEFEALGWEDKLPTTGLRVQTEMNKDVEACDLFVLVLDKLWGPPNKDAVWHPVKCLPGIERLRRSYTMEEFSLAMSRWEGKQKRPIVHVVLKELSAEAVFDPGPELECVLEFRKILAQSKTVLYQEWRQIEEFKTIVDAILRRHAHEEAFTLGEAEAAARAALDGRIEEARKYFARVLDDTTNPQVLFLGWEFFYRTGELDVAEHFLQRSLEITGSKTQTAETAAAYGNFGVIFRTRGDLNAAETMHRKALEIEESQGRPEGIAREYSNLGIVFRTRGDLNAAETMHHKALEIEEKLGRHGGTAREYGNLGVIYRTRGDLDEAATMHHRALAIEEKSERLEGMADQFGNLGLIFKARDDLDEAEHMLRKSLEINQKIGRLEGIASGYGNLGVISLARGELDEAEIMLRRGLEIDRKLGRLEGIADHYGKLGVIFQARGDSDQAEDMLRKSLEIAQKIGCLEGIATSHGILGLVFKTRGNLDEARNLWTRARDLFIEIGMPQMVENVQGWLDGLPDAEGDRPLDPLKLCYYLVLARRLDPDHLHVLNADYIRTAMEGLAASGVKDQAIIAQQQLAERFKDRTPNALWVAWMNHTQHKRIEQLRKELQS